jgi:hypothetical protein
VKNYQFLVIWLLLMAIFGELVYLNVQVAKAAPAPIQQPAVTASLVTPAPPVTHPLFSAKQRYAHDNSGQHYNIYTGNDPHHWTRLRLTRQGNIYLPRFTVSALDVHGWNYPNIGQGANHGMVPATPELGRKTWYPVRANHDGDPYATLSDHLIWSGNWQAGFDVWFEPRYDARGQRQQYGGTELMILTAVSRHGHAVNRGLPGYPKGSVYADGRWWNVSASVTGQGAKTWHRIYVAAQKPLTSFSGPLNPFFRVAEHFGMLNGNHYLTGLEYGFEINTGGIGMAVNSYNLHGVANSAAKHASYGLPSVKAYRVPKVTGLRQVTAAQRLRSGGWGVRLLTPYARNRTLVVSAQSPRAGSAVRRKLQVTVKSR